MTETPIEMTLFQATGNDGGDIDSLLIIIE